MSEIDPETRRRLLEAAAGPSSVPCPNCTHCMLCGGYGRVSPDVAAHWSVRNASTAAPPPPETTAELPALPETD